MEGHVGLEYRFVSRAETHGVLAPVGRIVETGRIAHAGFLDDAMFGDGPPPGSLDLLACRPRLGRVQPGGDPIQNHARGIRQFLRRLAQIDRARHRAMVAVARRPQFQDRRLALDELGIAPGQMRRRGAHAGGQHGNEGGVVAPELGSARGLGVIDGRRRIALTGTRHHRIDCHLHNPLHDAGGLGHILDLLGRFDRADPVHQ